MQVRPTMQEVLECQDLQQFICLAMIGPAWTRLFQNPHMPSLPSCESSSAKCASRPFRGREGDLSTFEHRTGFSRWTLTRVAGPTNTLGQAVECPESCLSRRASFQPCPVGLVSRLCVDIVRRHSTKRQTIRSKLLCVREGENFCPLAAADQPCCAPCSALDRSCYSRKCLRTMMYADNTDVLVCMYAQDVALAAGGVHSSLGHTAHQRTLRIQSARLVATV